MLPVETADEFLWMMFWFSLDFCWRQKSMSGSVSDWSKFHVFEIPLKLGLNLVLVLLLRLLRSCYLACGSLWSLYKFLYSDKLHSKLVKTDFNCYLLLFLCLLDLFAETLCQGHLRQWSGYVRRAVLQEGRHPYSHRAGHRGHRRLVAMLVAQQTGELGSLWGRREVYGERTLIVYT